MHLGVYGIGERDHAEISAVATILSRY